MEQIFSQEIDHLGLVAAMYDTLGIGSVIDSVIPQDMDNRNISIGTIAKALVINGLAFEQRTLYRLEDFFERKPVEALLGKDVQSCFLNDSVVGRAMDQMYSAGTTALFSSIAGMAFKVLGLELESGHLDSTSFHADGEYNSDEDPLSATRIIITEGYSRDHRPELNQAILNIIVDNVSGMPMFMKSASGNSSDKTDFREILLASVKNLQNVHQIKYFVTDSAGYTSETIQKISSLTLWVSRVPEVVSETKAIIAGIDKSLMEPFFGAPVDSGYSYTSFSSSYAGIPQTWLVIHSKEAYAREVETLRKNTQTNEKKEAAAFNKIASVEYACAADALTAFEKFAKSCKTIGFDEPKIVEKHIYESKGRPKAGTQPAKTVYMISADHATNIEAYRQKASKKGFFIVATNEINMEREAEAKIFDIYKRQSKVEKGFRFMKDPQLMANTFFVNKPERLDVFMMLMTISLLVYAALEYQLRKALEANKLTVPTQVKNKTTNKPTMRWIFQLFQGIHFFYNGDRKPVCLNVKEHQRRVIELLGCKFIECYLMI